MVGTSWVLSKKLARDLWRNFTQFIAIIFILATAVSLYVGLQSNSYEFERRVNNVYDKGNLADVWVTVNNYNEDDYNALLKYNDNDDGTNINKRMTYPVSVTSYSTYSLISENLPTINQAYDVEIEDNYEEDNSDFFFYIDQAFKDRFTDLKIGDSLNVTFSSALMKTTITTLLDSLDLNEAVLADCKSYVNKAYETDEVTYTFKVNAFMSQPENIQNATFNNAYFFLGTKYLFYKAMNLVVDAYPSNASSNPYSTKPVFDSLVSKIKDQKDDSLSEVYGNFMNQYVIKLKSNVTSDDYIDNINKYFNGNNRLSSVMNKDNIPSNSVIQNDIKQAHQLTYVFPTIFFVVAILIVLTTISQMVIKQRIQIGTMKSLGFSRRRILFYFIGLMSVVSTIGVVLGCIIGPLVIGPVMDIKYTLLYSLPSFQTYWPFKEMIIVLVLVLALVIILTSIIIHSELRETPANSMRPRVPNYTFRKTKSESKHISWMMAKRNIRIHFTKSLMVIVGIMGCTGLLICGMGIDDTIEYDKNIDMNNFYCTDVNVAYSPLTTSLKDTIEAIDGVKVCEEFSVMSVQASDEAKTSFENTNVYYFDKDSTNFGYGSWDEDGIGICEKIADDLGVKEGDKVNFSYNGTDYVKTINKVFYTFSIKGLFVYTSTIEGLDEYRTNAWVNIKDGADADKVSNAIKEVVGVSSTQTKKERTDTINGYVSAVSQMTIVVKVFAIILAVIVLINLAILNFAERLREIATLRVLGFKRHEIAASLIYEVMILTIVGALFGLCIGYPLTYIVLYVNITPLVTYNYYVGLSSYIIGFVISVITAFVVNWFISRRVNKIDMAESLKSVE